MRALVISAVVGALALSGCQNMEYDKAAIGTGIGALLGAGLAYSNADKDKIWIFFSNIFLNNFFLFSRKITISMANYL